MSHLELFLKHMFIHKMRIKMFHFQSNTFGHHKSSDDYYSKFCNNFDKFFEIAQGKYGRFNIKSLKIPPFDVQTNNIVVHINNFIVLLRSLDHFIDCKELLTLRDEMVNDVLQLKYLLSFK